MESVVITKRARRWSHAVCMLMVIMLSAVTPLAHGARAGGFPASPVLARELENPGPGGEADRWWGALGAVLCGVEGRLIRTAPALGMNPYAIAAGLGGCILALMDV